MRLGLRFYEFRKVWAERLHRPAYAVIARAECALARRRQARYCRTYIGITGSSGKSTTAHLVAAVLEKSGTVARGDLVNTERGVFRTLRKLDAPVDYVVQEISAAGGPGYLARMVDNLRFDVSIITSIGKEHRAAFPDVEAIAEEKSRIVRAVHPGGLSVLNADNPLVMGMAKRAGGRVVTFGRSPEATVRAENVTARWPTRLGFDLVIGQTRRHVATRFAGTIMLPNVLAALAVAHGLGLDIDAAIAAIGEVEAVFEHLSVNQGGDGHTYILDTFKAPLWATIQLVDDLDNFAGPNTVLVLSQLSDRYGDSGAWYRRLMKRAAERIGLVIALDVAGERAARLIDQDKVPNVVRADTVADAAALLKGRPPSLVILKGADVTKLLRIYLASHQRVTCTRRHCELKYTCKGCPILDAEIPG